MAICHFLRKEFDFILFSQETSFILMGGLVVGTLIQKTGLHKRVALRILTLVGEKTGISN